MMTVSMVDYTPKSERKSTKITPAKTMAVAEQSNRKPRQPRASKSEIRFGALPSDDCPVIDFGQYKDILGENTKVGLWGVFALVASGKEVLTYEQVLKYLPSLSLAISTVRHHPQGKMIYTLQETKCINSTDYNFFYEFAKFFPLWIEKFLKRVRVGEYIDLSEPCAMMAVWGSVYRSRFNYLKKGIIKAMEQLFPHDLTFFGTYDIAFDADKVYLTSPQSLFFMQKHNLINSAVPITAYPLCTLSEFAKTAVDGNFDIILDRLLDYMHRVDEHCFMANERRGYRFRFKELTDSYRSMEFFSDDTNTNPIVEF